MQISATHHLSVTVSVSLMRKIPPHTDQLLKECQHFLRLSEKIKKQKKFGKCSLLSYIYYKNFPLVNRMRWTHLFLGGGLWCRNSLTSSHTNLKANDAGCVNTIWIQGGNIYSPAQKGWPVVRVDVGSCLEIIIIIIFKKYSSLHNTFASPLSDCEFDSRVNRAKLSHNQHWAIQPSS